MKKIIVTGGAGFIGGNFVYYLLETHSTCHVMVLDALTYAGQRATLERAVQMYPDRLIFVQANICNRNAVYTYVEKYAPDFVVNFAAETHVDRSLENPQIFLETNVLGTQVLMDACIRYRVKRFHQISTDEVFGSLPLDRPEVKFTEASPYNPSSPYSASKAAADHLVRAYGRSFGLQYTISNCSNNYGPYHFPEKVIPLFITNLLDGKTVPIYGEGKNVRNWLHVKDHCRAIDAILTRGRTQETYLIGGNESLSNTELAKMVTRKMGYDEKMIEYVDDRRGHDLRYDVECSKIRKELDWEPQTTLPEGLHDTILWYKNNEWWWRPLIKR